MTTGTTQIAGREGQRKVLSPLRLGLTLVALLMLIVVGLTGLVVHLVNDLFDDLTPKIEADLRWKALRGAKELAQTVDLGLVIKDDEMVRGVFREFSQGGDLLGIVAVDAESEVVAQHGDVHIKAPFSGVPDAVRFVDGVFLAWSISQIEGSEVGRVSVSISGARLEAGESLRHGIIVAAVGGGIAAFVLGLLYLALYVLPLVRLTLNSFASLEQKTQEALESTRLKGEFLANMSHEIRTPMNGVLGSLQLLMQADLPPQYRRYVELALRAGHDLLALLNDILDFSKIEAGRLDLDPINFDLRDTVEQVAALTAVRGQGSE